jgi:hypothetical protein
LIVVSFAAIAARLQEPLVFADELLNQSSVVHAPPPVEWKKTLEREACSVKQTTDGGYVLVGSDGGGAWIVKTDAYGDQLWNRTYGKTGFEASGRAVQQTLDGGYIMAGGIRSDSANYGDARLVKIDKDGNVEWERIYGGAGHEYAFSAQQTNDGGYVLAGVAAPFGINNDDFYLVKTDPLGNVEWNRTYGGARNDIAWSVQQTLDGGYIMAGETYSFGAVWTDCWLVKTDASGNMEWNKTYGSERFDAAHCVRQTSDGGYILAGFSNWDGGQREYGGDFYLVKTDSKGEGEWHTNFGTSEGIDWAYSVEQTSDGGYVAAGDTTSFGSGSKDGWLIKTDSHLNLEWNKTLAGSPALAVIQTDDRGFAVAGKSFIKIMRANPPIVCFTYSPNSPAVHDEIVFNASASYDLDGDIISYIWRFGDGNVSSSASPLISHTYDIPQRYSVTLTVVDAEDLNSSYSLEVWARMITAISISTRTSSTVVGFAVNITGTLADMYGESLKNERVTLHYASSSTHTWTLLTSVYTNSHGNYFAMWVPQATGYFTVKAVYSGNYTHAESSSNVTLSILPYENQYFFTLESNSTISDLTFDTASRRLSFSVSGENGTFGYTRVTIAKSLINDITKLKVHIDGTEYNYTVADMNDSWLLFFTYSHSFHQVEVGLGEAPIPEYPIALILSVFVAIVLVGVIIYKRKSLKLSSLDTKRE